MTVNETICPDKKNGVVFQHLLPLLADIFAISQELWHMWACQRIATV